MCVNFVESFTGCSFPLSGFVGKWFLTLYSSTLRCFELQPRQSCWPLFQLVLWGLCLVCWDLIPKWRSVSSCAPLAAILVSPWTLFVQWFQGFSVKFVSGFYLVYWCVLAEWRTISESMRLLCLSVSDNSAVNHATQGQRRNLRVKRSMIQPIHSFHTLKHLTTKLFSCMCLTFS